eukprot:2525819-Ditylum_brightwellii.AAC.1
MATSSQGAVCISLSGSKSHPLPEILFLWQTLHPAILHQLFVVLQCDESLEDFAQDFIIWQVKMTF